MHRTSIFKIKADLTHSHGAYLYDLNMCEEVLDLFGMYASLPLGYSHPVFSSEDFVVEALSHLAVKLPNCEMNSLAAERFLETFTRHPSMKPFKYFHFCCTGALAIETAIKTAIIHKQVSNIATFTSSFHGINSYGGLLASASGPAAHRVLNLPHVQFGIEIPDPVEDGQDALNKLTVLGSMVQIAAVIVEPIQCTAGDVVLSPVFLRKLRDYCTATNTVLIFDEIQTGFGGTGTLWYYEQLGFIPDIVVFGKKTQVSGIMVREKFGKIFSQPEKLEVTWDGDVLDMIRCRVILETYSKSRILRNVRERELQFVQAIPMLRHAGLLLALDFESTEERDRFVDVMWKTHRTIQIPTGKRSVRWRPNLALSQEECDDAITRIQDARTKVAA
jgi:L-lysine 6-transaminase